MVRRGSTAFSSSSADGRIGADLHRTSQRNRLSKSKRSLRRARGWQQRCVDPQSYRTRGRPRMLSHRSGLHRGVTWNIPPVDVNAMGNPGCHLPSTFARHQAIARLCWHSAAAAERSQNAAKTDQLHIANALTSAIVLTAHRTLERSFCVRGDGPRLAKAGVRD